MKINVEIERVNNSEAYFLLTKDGIPYISSDDFISKRFNIDIDVYHERLTEKVINHVDHIIDTGEAYFNLKENDVAGEKLLIDKFKEEFFLELVSLNLSQEI